jgi:hypothetical protein
VTKRFDIGRFQKETEPVGQYERQIARLQKEKKEVVCIEQAVRGALENRLNGLPTMGVRK